MGWVIAHSMQTSEALEIPLRPGFPCHSKSFRTLWRDTDIVSAYSPNLICSPTTARLVCSEHFPVNLHSKAFDLPSLTCRLRRLLNMWKWIYSKKEETICHKKPPRSTRKTLKGFLKHGPNSWSKITKVCVISSAVEKYQSIFVSSWKSF